MKLLLDVSSEIQGEIGSAAIYALTGFAIVVSALGVLVLFIILLNKVLNVGSKKKVTTEKVTQTAPVQDADVPVAVIAAVVAMLMSENITECEAEESVPAVPFKIKSIKKLSEERI